jgi:hypothetical protein
VTRRRSILLCTLLALASVVVVLVTAVRATHCAKAASVVENAHHVTASPTDPRDDAPTSEAADTSSADDGTGLTCTSYCPLPSAGHELPVGRAASPDQLPASDEAPPGRPPAALERPPRC